MLLSRWDRRAAIDAARGFAALIVAMTHLRNHMFIDYKSVVSPELWFKALAFLSGFSGQAVTAFFVISGWLVGGGFYQKVRESGRFPVVDYAIDRITRLWTVLIPVFGLSLALRLVLGAPSAHGLHSFGASTFFGNLIGAQTILVGQYGENYPLWSLANETAYYVAFPLGLYTLRQGEPMWARLASGLALALAAVVLPHRISLYFVVWLIGFACSRVSLTPLWRTALAPALAVAAVSARMTRQDGVFWVDIALALLFALLLSTTENNGSVRRRRFTRLFEFFASFSFTLYVLHVPLIYALEACGALQLSKSAGLRDAFAYASHLLLIVVVAWALSWVTERRTHWVRSRVRLLMPRGGGALS